MRTRYHTRQDKDEHVSEFADKVVVPRTGWCGFKWLPGLTLHFPSLSMLFQVLSPLSPSFPRFPLRLLST